MRFREEKDIFNIEIRTDEDLWYISLILKPGDLIIADVLRRVERKNDTIRNKKTERQKVNVTIRIESLEFMEISARVHIVGSVIYGPEDLIGEHQSINIEKGDFLNIIPSNRDEFLKGLEESSGISENSVLILSIDDEEISLYSINETRNELLWSIKTGHGKMYGEDSSDYMEEVKKLLKNEGDREFYIIGPSLFRDSLAKILSKEGVRAVNTQISGSREDGIRELLQSSLLDLRRSTESRIITEFLKKINSETAAYGIEKVRYLLDMRAVDTLIMTDKFFREKNSKDFLNRCREGSCKVFVVHSSWETGKIIQSFGGLVAILRYRIPQDSSA